MSAPVVPITASNTTDFVFGRLLTDSAARYDLSGVIRAHMRDTPASVAVRYAWTTLNGRLTLVPTPAGGWFTLGAQPTAGSRIRIGAAIRTFVTGAPEPLDVQIGASLGASLANLRTALAAGAEPDLAALTFSVSGNQLALQAKVTGPDANAITLATDVSGAETSGDTLTGGGVVLVMTAPQAEVGRFTGTYAYDVRLEQPAGAPSVVLFGGAITWVQGTTRGPS